MELHVKSKLSEQLFCGGYRRTIYNSGPTSAEVSAVMNNAVRFGRQCCSMHLQSARKRRKEKPADSLVPPKLHRKRHRWPPRRVRPSPFKRQPGHTRQKLNL